MTRIARLLTVLVGLLSTFPEAAMADGTQLIKKFIPECGKYHGRELLKKNFCTTLKGDVCIVEDNQGGCGLDFNEIYHFILDNHITVRFEGSVRSSAAVIAAFLSQKAGVACVGLKVEFAFHQSWFPGPNSKRFGDEFGHYEPNKYPRRIQEWINAQPGGEPASIIPLRMPYSVAVNFWQKCPELEPNVASK